MYGQGSYNSQFGQGPNTPMPPPNQQRLPGPPPLPPHFHQGPPLYQHGLPAPLPAVHQVPLGGAMPNTSQSYRHSQPTVHGNTPFQHIYSMDQQNTQLPSHLRMQNVHHMPPSVPPPPPRGLPPPPPLPTMYRAPVHLQSLQSGGSLGIQHMPPPPPTQLPPPPPPPSTSSFFTSSPFGSFGQSTGGNTNMPSTAHLPPPPPPLPPSSPPPVPPSPSPPSSPLLSSMHHQAASNLINSNKLSGSKLNASSCVDKDETSNEVIRHNVPLDDGYLNQEGSLVRDGLSKRGSVDPSLPPSKPTEEEVVQKIEDFHDSHLSPLGTDSQTQPNHLVVEDGSYSPADSDMEMEDDITQSGNEQGVNHSTEGTNSRCDSIHSELDVKEQLHAQQISAGCYPAKNISSEMVSFSGSPVPAEQGQTFERPISKVRILAINSAAEQPLASNLEKSDTLLPDEKIPSGASEVAEGTIKSEKNSFQGMKGGSPFRLLQEYDSDDISDNDDELHLEVVSPTKDSSSVAVDAPRSQRDKGCNLDADITSKSLSKTEKGFDLLSGLSMSNRDCPQDLGREAQETATSSIATRTTDEHLDDKHDNQASISHALSYEAIQMKDVLGGACVEVSLDDKVQKDLDLKSARSASDSLKVDEFGRLVRKSASDSDSDDPRYDRKQSRRGRSRSQSPHRRRRSPRRRRERRSRSRSRSPRIRKSRSKSPRNQRSKSPRNQRSRSRSPRKRRSRSRSPAFRHVGEFSGDRVKRNRGQIPDCFDFRRGRCYRGASCRYLHHDSDKSDGSRRHKSKQSLEVPAIPKNSNHEEVKHTLKGASDQEHEEVKISEMQLCQDVLGSSSEATKDGNCYKKREDHVQSGSFNQDGVLIDFHTIKSESESSRETAAEVSDTPVLQKETEVPTTLTNESCREATESHHTMLVDGFPSYPVIDTGLLKSHGDASRDILPVNHSMIKQTRPNLSDPLLQPADCLPQQTDNSSISDSFPEQAFTSSVDKLPTTEALPNTSGIGHHSLQLPPPPPLPQGVATQHMIQPPGDYNSGERFRSSMLPNQESLSTISTVAPWTSLPPPPPGVSSQLQQSQLPPNNDFGSQIMARPYVTGLPTHSQVADFQQRAYPQMQEPHRSVSQAEDFRLKPLSLYNPPSQQFGGPSLVREDHLPQLPVLGLSASSSFTQGNNQPLPTPLLRELPVNKMQPYPGDNFHPGEHLKSSSQIHPYLQQQRPSYGLHQSTAVSSSSRYPPDLQEINHSSHLPHSRGTYYNPYASGIEQPLSSKFSSDVFRQEDTTYGGRYAAPFSFSHSQVGGQDIGSVGSRQATSSPNSARLVGQNFPRSGDDQYDPLLDSIEPSSNLSKKIKNAQKWEPSSDSDIMLRHSGSNKPLDVEENNKSKEVGGVALATSVDDEEYGETADAEVGAVENGSLSTPIDEDSMPMGEIEIDQIKSPRRSKKSKDSRSTKLFKVALADFVKEVLKPSWRQGNMSKEAFKTIVKKTVDKVSGAMKSHQIPKSRAKIDHYIDSSQRKLTKLVTGYVDKYVKM